MEPLSKFTALCKILSFTDYYTSLTLPSHSNCNSIHKRDIWVDTLEKLISDLKNAYYKECVLQQKAWAKNSCNRGVNRLSLTAWITDKLVKSEHALCSQATTYAPVPAAVDTDDAKSFDLRETVSGRPWVGVRLVSGSLLQPSATRSNFAKNENKFS